MEPFGSGLSRQESDDEHYERSGGETGGGKYSRCGWDTNTALKYLGWRDRRREVLEVWLGHKHGVKVLGVERQAEGSTRGVVGTQTRR